MPVTYVQMSNWFWGTPFIIRSFRRAGLLTAEDLRVIPRTSSGTYLTEWNDHNQFSPKIPRSYRRLSTRTIPTNARRTATMTMSINVQLRRRWVTVVPRIDAFPDDMEESPNAETVAS